MLIEERPETRRHNIFQIWLPTTLIPNQLTIFFDDITRKAIKLPKDAPEVSSLCRSKVQKSEKTLKSLLLFSTLQKATTTRGYVFFEAVARLQQSALSYGREQIIARRTRSQKVTAAQLASNIASFSSLWNFSSLYFKRPLFSTTRPLMSSRISWLTTLNEKPAPRSKRVNVTVWRLLFLGENWKRRPLFAEKCQYGQCKQDSRLCFRESF